MSGLGYLEPETAGAALSKRLFQLRQDGLEFGDKRPRRIDDQQAGRRQACVGHLRRNAEFEAQTFSGANCALDQLRSRRRRDAALAPALDGDGETTDLGAANPEHRIFHAQLGRIVQRTLEEMTEQERAAFVLRHYEQMNTTEIGQLLATSGPAIRQSIFRAVKKLRAALMPVLERKGSIQ